MGIRMLCVSCGKRMRLVWAVPDDTMIVPGYENHILECVGCGETERRLVFRHASEPWTEPTTQPNNGRDEVPCVDAQNVGVVEPTASNLTPRTERSAEPDQHSESWERRI